MKNILCILWPPYEFFLSKQINPLGDNNQERWESVLTELKVVIPLEADELEDAEKLASSILEAEIKRKDVLESKAATFIIIPTVATSITAAIAPLTKDLGITGHTATVITICYTLALVHLLISSYYAIQARRAEGFLVLSAINGHKLLSKPRIERIETRLAYARMNEPALLMKSNKLSVAEDLFLRGVAFLTVAAFSALIAHIFGI